MDDSETTGRRPKFVEGDIERASKARRHPRPAGAPILDSILEDDVTPLPQEPPDISQIDGFEELPATIKRGFVTLWNTSREHDVAFAKLWGARHVGDDVAQIRTLLDGYRPYFQYLENVHQGMDALGKRVQGIAGWIEQRQRMDEKLDRTIEAFQTRLNTFDSDFRDMKAAMSTLGRDIAEGWRRRDAELEKFKVETEARFAKIDAEHDKERERYEGRIRSLEDSRTSQNAKLAAIGTVIAVLAWLLNHFWK